MNDAADELVSVCRLACWFWGFGLVAACRHDTERPSFDHLRVPSTDPRVVLLIHRGMGAGPHVVDALLDAVRLGPRDDATTVTATQLREVVERLQQAGQHKTRGTPTSSSCSTLATT